jgi:protein required for attachment to host cells
MILPTGTTVAVTDGETVRLFHNTGVKHGVHLIEVTAVPPAPTRSGSGARLNKLSLDGTIEHLVVVSDPRTLGEMRKHFHRDLKGKIIREFAKDFSRRPLEDITSLIADA